MSRLRISLSGLVAMCLASMFMAVAASAAGPFWHTNGAKLKQGSVGVKLQNKGTLSLQVEFAALAVTITCGRSTSNATIDGQGETRQGQSKNLIKYEQCRVTGSAGGTCEEPTTITTNPLKAHLVTGTVQSKTQIMELFEPAPNQIQAGFVKILFLKCTGPLATLSGVNAPLRGSIVAQVAPQEVESQEDLLNFPPEPITEVEHEGQKRVVGLTFSERPATFTGTYSARVQGGTFGVFRT